MHLGWCSVQMSKPRMKALTLSQIEARVEDPTIALEAAHQTAQVSLASCCAPGSIVVAPLSFQAGSS